MKYILAFAIVLLMSSAAMGVEVVLTASGTADDVFYDWDGSDTYTTYERDSLVVGYRSSTSRWYGFGITFDNVRIPQNATITSCVLRVKTKRAFSSGGIGCGYYSAFALDGHSVAPISGGAWDLSNSPYGGAQGSNISVNTEFNIDCGTTSLQNTVGLDAWAYGNSVTLYVADDGQYGSDSYLILQSVQTFAHTLTINYDYTPPSSGRQLIRVQASTDDVLQVTGDDVYPTATVRVGNSGGTQYNMGLRFLNAQIPNGCNVDTLYLTFRASDVYTGTTCIGTLEGEDVDDAATFSTNSNYTGRTRTTAAVVCTIATWGTSGSFYSIKNCPDVGDEIFSRPGWAPGNDFVLFLSNNGSSTDARRIGYAWDTDARYGAVVTIVYSPAPSGTPDGRRRRMMLGVLDERFPTWGQWERVQ